MSRTNTIDGWFDVLRDIAEDIYADLRHELYDDEVDLLVNAFRKALDGVDD